MSAKSPYNLTPRHMEIARIVGRMNDTEDDNERLVDLDQLLERMAKRITKESMQFSIRLMVNNGIIVKGERVKRRGRMRVVYQLTEIGKKIALPRAASPAFLEPDLTF